MVSWKTVMLAVLGAAMAVPAGAEDDPKITKEVRQLIAMSPDDHAAKVVIEDDELETSARLLTLNSFQAKRGGLLRRNWSDIFLRAFVDKSSGEARIQAYFTLDLLYNGWPRLERANYLGPDGVESVEVTKIGSDVDCSSTRLYGGCFYQEIVAFPIEERLARSLAADYVPNGQNWWRVRFKGQSGLDLDMRIMPAEFAGLLMRVDQYRAQHGLTP